MKRLPSLDGWRAIAILLVLGSHICYSGSCPPLVAYYTSLLFDGGLGVRLFFVISGFIITWLLLEEQGHTNTINLRGFYFRRALRIFPAYGAFLFAIAGLQLAGRCDEVSASWLGNLTMTRNYFGRGDSPTVHFWTLAIEQQFYLLWPGLLVVFALHRKRRTVYALAAIVILAAIAARSLPIAIGGGLWDRLTGGRSLFRYMDSLALGCVLAFHQWPAVRPARLLIVVVGWIVLIGAWLVQQALGASPFDLVAPTLQAAGFCCVLSGSMHPGTWTYRLLNTALLQYVGAISYSLYIWHTIFLVHFAPRAMPWPILNHWLVWPIPATIVAILSWRFIERPFLKMHRKGTSRNVATNTLTTGAASPAPGHST